ncbi:MAG: HIRAN domain-containing protein [Lysobacterales bacterium]
MFSAASASLLPPPHSTVLPAGLRARVWIAAGNFFSRADVQGRCWLWLHRHDGRVDVVRTQAACLERDDLLAPLLAALDSEHSPASRCEPVSFDAGMQAWRLPDAPVVPVPRWQVSWGHPLQRAIRAFASSLDMDVMQALGDLEVAGPFFGSAANYNRLATLPRTLRTHRLQALAEFPPLVAPLLLDVIERPDMFGDDAAQAISTMRRATPALLDAIDLGRDLIGALATQYRVGRALVRSPVCRSPWAEGEIPEEALRLLDALPPAARPSRASDVEPRLALLRALPFQMRSARDAQHLASAFAQGWNATWAQLEARYSPLPTHFGNTRDFLTSALEQAALPESLAGLSRDRLGLAWAARRGLESLLRASRRWHERPLEELPASPSVVASVERLDPAIAGVDLADGNFTELLTPRALIDEGESMHHCVGGYWDQCLTQGTRIVHLERPDGERATAQYELAFALDNPFFDLSHVLGPRNAASTAATEQFAEALTEAMNAPERRPVRERIAAQAREAWQQLQRVPSSRRTIRRLDTQSRRELALVLAWCTRQADWQQAAEDLYAGRIAGFQYHDGPRLLDRLKAGDALALVREPANQHDHLAVRVTWHGHPLGYLPRAQNAAVARLLDAGAPLDARIAAVRRGNATWDQVGIVVGRSVAAS